jgi:hypothetical protein
VIKVYAYTCDGLNGHWQGDMTVHSNLGSGGLPQTAAEVFGQPLNPEGNVESQFQALIDLQNDRTQDVQVMGPIGLRFQVDSAAVEHGQYGVVGRADFLLDENVFPPFFWILSPTADLPIRRYTESNKENLDEVCPGTASYFP